MRPPHAGKMVRGGVGGRNAPYCYTATAKGRGSLEEASRKLAADEALLASRGAGEAAGAAAS